jgi:hypothetical protein
MDRYFVWNTGIGGLRDIDRDTDVETSWSLLCYRDFTNRHKFPIGFPKVGISGGGIRFMGTHDFGRLLVGPTVPYK